MLAPPSIAQPTRISQILPTVKCSSCHQPVPLAELGDHTCVIPQVPAVPSFNSARPTPSRLVSPASPRAGPHQPGTPPVRTPQSPQPPMYRGPPQPNRPRIDTSLPGPSSYTQRSDTPAQSERGRTNASISLQRPQTTSPLKPSLPASPWPADGHARSTTPASLSPLPPPANPRVPQSGISPRSLNPGSSQFTLPSSPANRTPAFTPPVNAAIDTKSGGAAGMAGVGRRGFAAAARAAMFAPMTSHPLDAARRANPPRFLDTDAASRSTDTPPLSASSGYSSHSPGPVSPIPQAELIPEPVSKQPRSTSPSQPIKTATFDQPPLPTKLSIGEISNGAGSSPLARLPFFEKFKNKFPGADPGPEPTAASRTSKANTRDTMGSLYSNGSSLLRNISASSSQIPKRDFEKPPSPDSGSEYGLAYADSTDDEGDVGVNGTRKSKTSLSPSSILRSGAAAANSIGRVHFPPSSSRSSSSSQVTSSHDNSASSLPYSGRDSARGRGGSAAIAQALGLSQTPPNEYGGPGISGSFGRQRSASSSSSDSRSTYSRVTSAGPMVLPSARLPSERTMEPLLEDIEIGGSSEGSPKAKSEPAEKQRSSGQGSISKHQKGESMGRGIGSVTMSSGSKAHRSNTVQVPNSPEAKSPKLPTRAKTTSAGAEHNKSVVDSTAGEASRRKEKVKKTRICLRCQKKIEDGRWVQVDTGGSLCERCWKNMYLPKCRRCQRPIERQAVSSADGQLKGKYHKECFNCHVCHKPFPDKSFYVYDGKPLCAYHYHEANDSLCAAARCGQPIEGPCAVSHTGDKYHPEHMTCEHPGSPPCRERLTEYWEVDGRMLCEKHAARVSRGEDEDEEWIKSSKAKKRVTRFIDLTGGNIGNGGTEDESLL